VQYLLITLLQISWRMWQWNSCENRPVFDDVIRRLRTTVDFWPTLQIADIDVTQTVVLW